MTKDVLNQYCDLIKEIPKLQKKIKKLEEQSDMASDVVQNGYKRHAIIYGYDVMKAKKLKQLKDILVEREAKAIIQKVEIENFINTIDKSDVRQIFEHRYMENMDWYQVADEMNYNNEDTPRKKHDRFLEKIKKI